MCQKIAPREPWPGSSETWTSLVFFFFSCLETFRPRWWSRVLAYNYIDDFQRPFFFFFCCFVVILWKEALAKYGPCFIFSRWWFPSPWKAAEDGGYTLKSQICKILFLALPLQDHRYCHRYLKKNQTTPRPSEHPPVMGEKMSKRLGGIKDCKYKTSSCCLFNPTRSQIRSTSADKCFDDIFMVPPLSPPLLSLASLFIPNQIIKSNWSTDRCAEGVLTPLPLLLLHSTYSIKYILYSTITYSI